MALTLEQINNNYNQSTFKTFKDFIDKLPTDENKVKYSYTIEEDFKDNQRLVNYVKEVRERILQK